MNKKPNDLKHIAQILRSHPFVPPKFLQSPHIQTFFASLVPSFKTTMPKPERRYITLSDGSKLGADCWFQKEKEKHSTVVILSGLEGYNWSEKSRFRQGIGDKAYFYGFNVIHLKQRGEADTIHLTKSLFAAYPVDDLATAFDQFIHWGLKRMYLVGTSAGGWAGLFTLSHLEERIKRHIAGAVAISPPVNLIDTWKHVEKNRVYNWLLLQSYKNLVKRRIRVDSPDDWDIVVSKAAKSTRQWAEAFFPYGFGYKEKYMSVDDYNKKTDLALHFSKIHVPVLHIHSQDDPVTPATREYPNIITLFPKHGGHGGFFTFRKLYGDLDRHWAQNRAMEFIRLLDVA